MNEISKTNLWSKNFVVVSVINFLLMTIYYMLLVTIGSYVVEMFNVSKSIAGLVTGIMVIGCLGGRFVTGYLIELIGCKKVLFIGIILFIVSTLAYFIAFNLLSLIMIRFINGIAIGMVGTVTGTIVCYVIPLHRRGEGISYFSLSTILAAAIGPFVGLLLILYVPFNTLLALGLVSGFISLGIASVLTINSLSLPTHSGSTSSWFKLSNFIEPKAVNISLVVMITSLGYAVIQAYLSFYAAEINLMGAASFFFVVYAVAVLVSRPFTGKLLDLKGENIIVYPTLTILVLGFILFSQANSTFLLLLSGALIGLGFGNFQSVAQAVAVKVSPPHKIGQATSTFFIFLDFGIGLGPYFLGSLIPYIGYRGLYLLAALITVIAIALYYLLHGRYKDRIEVIEESENSHLPS